MDIARENSNKLLMRLIYVKQKLKLTKYVTQFNIILTKLFINKTF